MGNSKIKVDTYASQISLLRLRSSNMTYGLLRTFCAPCHIHPFPSYISLLTLIAFDFPIK